MWLDADLDRNFGASEGVFAAPKAADPQVIQPTGRTQRMYAKQGGERDAHEVELILDEDQLVCCCWCCNTLEVDTDVRDNDRFKLCSGEGYTSTYMCHQVGGVTLFIVNLTYNQCQCAGKSAFARTVSGFLRSLP